MGGRGPVCIPWLTKVATAAQDVGVRVLAVQAINEPAKRFYKQRGLEPTATDESTGPRHRPLNLRS